jgi:hypothetical protein
MLDIVNTTKGLLIPRVSLVATNNNAPVGVGIATSLMVYNIATAGVSPNNVLPGYYYWDGTEWIAIAGDGSKNWSLLGNAGTVDGTNFIGTTDNVPLNFRVNNQKAGRIDNTLGNSFFGHLSGNSNTGIRNTGIGSESLLNNIGSFNSAMGYWSLYSNISGGFNSAFGVNSLFSNTSGQLNCAFGNSALQSNTSGFYNTAMGVNALFGCTTGSNNVGSGSGALSSLNTGNDNVAVGYNAFSNAGSSSRNTICGAYALQNKPVSSNSCAFGYKAMQGVFFPGTSTNGNTAIGSFALFNVSEDYCTALGDSALFIVTSGTNNIGIGYNAQVPSGTLHNQMRIGNTSITYAGVQVAWTITSDKKWKSEIKPSNLGLDFIKALKPVYYMRNNDESKKTEYGFIAQEVDEMLTKFGCTNNGIISKDDAGMLGMRYNDLMSITVKAMQEQQKIIDYQNEKIKSLEERLNLLEAKLK